jgi:hypothetical protein
VRTGRELRPGREAQDTLLILKALGVEYVVAHGPKSGEYYRDYSHPRRLDGAAPVVYQQGDDFIYALPARPLAHLVSREELPGKDPQNHPSALEAYVSAMGDDTGPRLHTHWLDHRTLVVEGEAPPGRLAAVGVSWDPGWRATQDGTRLAIERDNLGFIIMQPAASKAAHIELRYTGTGEQRLMAALSALAWAALLLLLFRPAIGGPWRSLRPRASGHRPTS